MAINFRGRFFSFQHYEKNYRVVCMFIIPWALSTPWDVAPRESGCMLWETNHFLKLEQIKSKAWQHSTEKYHGQTLKFTPLAIGVTPFYPWVCLHHTFVVSNLILRCLTGSYITRLSKSNYCIRLNVNLNIADSISFYFNFGKGHYFFPRVKQNIFNTARFVKLIK